MLSLLPADDVRLIGTASPTDLASSSASPADQGRIKLATNGSVTRPNRRV